MAKKKKRRSPRKRAVNLEQTIEQLDRFQARLDVWLDKQGGLVDEMARIQRKIKTYRRKVNYYKSRLEEAGVDGRRELRSIQLN